MDQDSRIS